MVDDLIMSYEMIRTTCSHRLSVLEDIFTESRIVRGVGRGRERKESWKEDATPLALVPFSTFPSTGRIPWLLVPEDIKLALSLDKIDKMREYWLSSVEFPLKGKVVYLPLSVPWRRNLNLDYYK